jgi:hypothetical protein
MSEPIAPDWGLQGDDEKARQKLTEVIQQHASKLQKSLSSATLREEKHKAIHAFYRKYYTLTLCKSCTSLGIHRPPSRDLILDYPWQVLEQNRIECLKIWEKIAK